MSETEQQRSDPIRALKADIVTLTEALRGFIVEDDAAVLPKPEPGSPLMPLTAMVEHLKTLHLKVLHENEVQTVGEGEFEIKRRHQMRDVAARFNQTVGQALEELIAEGKRGTEATVNAVSAVTEAVESALRVDTVIKTVVERAESSDETVQQASCRAGEAIGISSDVETAAKQIVELVDVIDAISLQTNLLAINASIEAARAGKHGAGFRVVADAVKRLSADTTEAASKVKKTAIGMQQEARRMATSVGAIKDANNEVSEMTARTIEAINEQVVATKEISDRAEASSAKMNEVEAGIRAIQAGASHLTEKTSDFVRMVSAEPGVTSDSIIFGQSAPFTGSAASLGLGTRKGIELVFKEIEAQGGLHGRQLRLKALDDGYDPDRALENVRQLVRGGDVFGLVGAVGTPTSKLSERIARGGQVPFVGPVTGTDFLRTDDRRHVLNVRASYDDEAAALVACFREKNALSKCAFFYQADAYGVAVRKSLEKALARLSLRLEVMAPYDRATNDVSDAVERIEKAGPSIVFMASTSGPTADFVRAIRSRKLDPHLATISFVGATDFADRVGPDGAGVVISQVVPNPADQNIPLVRDYLATLKRHMPEERPDFAMLEGVVIGRLLCQLIESAGPTPTREGFLQAAMRTQNRFCISGLTLSYGPGNNRGTDAVFLTELDASSGFRTLSEPTAAQTQLAS